MSNSPLVNYIKLSPNYTQGRVSIIGVAIHCVVGQCSVETLGNVFAQSSKQASSNYGIGSDGRIGLYVSESNRSWCTSSSYVDNRVITIECASDTTAPYAVNDKVYASLIKLCADICKRNGIKKLVWSEDKAKRKAFADGCNMQVHRDWANKSCPGDYLYSRMQAIADAVNAILNGDPVPDPEPVVQTVSVKATVLKNDSEGSAVRKLQILLNGLGFNCGSVDGDFGAKTLAAVKSFQTHNQLDNDGIVGKKTWEALIG